MVIQPTKVILIGSILAAMSMSIKNKIEKLKINVKNDFIPLLPPIITIKANNIINSTIDTFIALKYSNLMIFKKYHGYVNSNRDTQNDSYTSSKGAYKFKGKIYTYNIKN